MSEKIQLSEHFTYGKIVRFTLPAMLMGMASAAFNAIDDGFFVSNFVGKDAFVAINLIAPVLMVVGAVGYMLGSGGAALIGKTLGEGDQERASRQLFQVVALSAGIGTIVAVVGFAFSEPLARLLGAQGQTLAEATTYARICSIFAPSFLLQGVFQSMLIVAERPRMAMGLTIVSGVSNIVFDTLLMVVLRIGIAGAALATSSGMVIGGIVPLVFFLRRGKDELHLSPSGIEARVVARVCANGAGGLVSNLSMGAVAIVYNTTLLGIAGSDGVAAYGVINYIAYIFSAILMGFGTGITPVVAYHFGAENEAEVRGLFRQGMTLMLGAGALLFALAQVAARPLALVFVSYDQTVLDMTVAGTRVYAIAFLLMGINLYAAAFFTALNDGLAAGIASFLRTFVFQVLSVPLMGRALGLAGVWWAVVVAEALSLVATVVLVIWRNPRYHLVGGARV